MLHCLCCLVYLILIVNMCMYLISNTCQVPWWPRGLWADTQALVLHWGWGLFPGTLSAAMWLLAHVVLFKYVAIVLNQCITRTAGNSPGQLLWGGKVRTWSFNKQGRLVHFTGATWEAARALCIQKISGHHFPLGTVVKRTVELQTFRTQFILKCKCL